MSAPAFTTNTIAGPETTGRVSVRSLLTAFDDDRRAAATRKGRPILRMASPSAPRRASTDVGGGTARFFFSRGDVMMCAMAGGPVQAATPDLIWDTMHSPGKVWVPVNGRVAAAMVRMMKSALNNASTPEATEKYGTALRTLRFAVSNTVSSKLIVLTDALERKFYAPAGVDIRKLTPWAKALGVTVTTADPGTGLAVLLAKCWEDAAQAKHGRRGDDPVLTILQSEQAAEAVCDRGGAGSNATQFGAAQAIATGWDTVCRIDPLLRQRCAAAGEVVRIRVIAHEKDGFRATVSGPVRLREGACILTSADNKDTAVSYVELKGFSVEDDGLQLILTSAHKQSARTAKDGMTTCFNAMHDKVDLYISGAPFLRAASTVAAKHWSGKQMPEEHRVTRDVPLYVMLAGA